MATTHNIDIARVDGTMKFDPDSKSVAQGDTVVWTNRTNIGHTVTADDGAFDSGQLQPNKTFSHTFDTAGTIGYHCEIHPFMTATVTVEPQQDKQYKGGGQQQAQTHNIEITTKAFPKETKVAKGDTVVWTNRMGMNHTVTADNGEFDSGPFGKDKSFSQKFDTAGTFPYHCEIHFDMQGQVNVT